MTWDDCSLHVSYDTYRRIPYIKARGTNITIRCRDKFIELRKYPTGILVARHWCQFEREMVGNGTKLECDTNCRLFDDATLDGRRRWEGTRHDL